ncbi:hypothetical protein Q31b_46060 [Novipirellula aureliae]|uniref:Uncharacterized protein n=1 Tax=Novipirellula aureliae TaxID=2527966 RepID=A0A5C6DPP4_9BACT|nr:hypothetical protein Q31b_46060 [Novipirellula aureliae]
MWLLLLASKTMFGGSVGRRSKNRVKILNLLMQKALRSFRRLGWKEFVKSEVDRCGERRTLVLSLLNAKRIAKSWLTNRCPPIFPFVLERLPRVRLA